MSALTMDAVSGTGVGLRDLAAEAGIALTETALARFDAYRDLLLDWNARFNLTAIDDPAAIDRRLFLDTLRLLPTIDAIAPSGDSVFLVDVGSGAGFPGLALKIARPALDVTLIEATGKKVAFLDACIEEVELDRARALHARAEEVGRDPAFRERFDLATARAVAALPVLLELCAPLVRLGGHALFPKGLNLAEEIAAGRRVAPIVGARLVSVEVLSGGQTTLVVAEKTGPTPAGYPRRPGIPAREPLGAGRRNPTGGRRSGRPGGRTP